jgi:hypothetical protein
MSRILSTFPGACSGTGERDLPLSGAGSEAAALRLALFPSAVFIDFPAFDLMIDGFAALFT